MGEIQQNRWDQLVRRVAGLIGPGSKVNNTIGDLFPMLDVENLPPELYVLGGTGLAFRSTDTTAASGQENASQLANPAGSGKLLTVTTVIIEMSAADIVALSLVIAELAVSNGFGAFRDRRVEGPGGSAAVGNLRTEDGVIVLPGLGVKVVMNVPFTITDPNGICVLAPGDRLTVGTQSLARRLIVSYFWRERVAEQSELLF